MLVPVSPSCQMFLRKPWAGDLETPDPSRSVLIDLQAMSDWRFPSIIEPEFETPELSMEEEMLTLSKMSKMEL